jgi:hypothetical protein
VPVLSLSGTSVSMTVAPTDPTPESQLTVNVTNPPSAGVWYSVSYTGSAVSSAQIVWSQVLSPLGALTGNLEIVPYSGQFIGSGTYHDTVTVMVCTDSKCANPISGSPISVPVTYTVTGNVISDASYNLLPTSLSLESKSTDPALSATVNVTAYEVPPYGAYVFYKSLSGGPVASMSFVQTSGNPEPYSYATGTLTVNMKLPATLGPGLYTDQITLSICYDQACTKPAQGTPLIIPVTYLVTAAVGREFQEQIIQENLTALAVDPTGTTLYGATEPNSQATSPLPAQLVSINPITLAVTTLLTLPAPISEIQVSSDGAYIYLATNGTGPPQVLRVRTSDMTMDQNLTLPNGFGSPAGVSVSPANSNTWSVNYQSLVNGVIGTQIVIYDGTVPRPNASTTVVGQVSWTPDGSSVYVPANNGVYSIPVNASGFGSATLLQPGGTTALLNEGGYLQLAGGLLYANSGQVIDPVANTIVGQYVLPTGVPYANVTVDVPNNRVFIAYGDPLPTGVVGTLQSFNLTTFAPMWIARLPNGGPLRWGSNGLAWIGPGAVFGTEALYLIEGSFVAP